MLAGNATLNTASSAVVRLLIRKLGSFRVLADDEISLIAACMGRPRDYPGGVSLPLQRRPLASLVVSGWVGRLRLLADGRRQVISTMISGELSGAHPNPFIPSGIVAMTDARIVDLTPLLDTLDREPSRHGALREALSLATRLEEAQLAEHVVRLGRRTAFERLAHWLLDLQQRLALAGLCEGERFHMPLTQEVLSDILGMSIVHVNRIVKQLRTENLIELRSGVVTILEPERLRMLAEFSPLKISLKTTPSGMTAENNDYQRRSFSCL